MKVAVKRVYDPPAKNDGLRILVDRLWPRGLAKEKAQIALWLRDIAPSDMLRKKYHGQAEDFEQFVAAYRQELKQPVAIAAMTELRTHMKKNAVTLLYAAKDTEHNNAVALLQIMKATPGPG